MPGECDWRRVSMMVSKFTRQIGTKLWAWLSLGQVRGCRSQKVTHVDRRRTYIACWCSSRVSAGRHSWGVLVVGRFPAVHCGSASPWRPGCPCSASGNFNRISGTDIFVAIYLFASRGWWLSYVRVLFLLAPQDCHVCFFVEPWCLARSCPSWCSPVLSLCALVTLFVPRLVRFSS